MKKNYFENERMEYEQIEIPEELDFVVRQAISVANKKRKKKTANMAGRVAGIAAAAIVLSLTLGANTSYAFAKAVSKIPVLKEVSQVLTFRDYSEEIDADPDPVKPIKKHNKQEETDPASQITPVNTEGTEEKETEKTPFEKWAESLSAEQLKQIVAVYSPAAAKESEGAGIYESTILLSYLSAEQAAEAGITGDVAVYGYHENGSLTGVAIRMGGVLHTFADWTYLNEDGMLPELSVRDLYGTGEKNLIVTLYNGQGSGIPVLKKESNEQQIEVSGVDGSDETASSDETKTAESEKDTVTIESKEDITGDTSVKETTDTGTVIVAGETEQKTETTEANEKEYSEQKPAEAESSEKEQGGQVIIVEKELTEAEKTCQVWVLHVTDTGLVCNLYDAEDFDPATGRSEN